MAIERGIFWFKSDLRIDDNAAFSMTCDNCTELLPVYILDESLLKPTEFGFNRLGPHRLKFLYESLIDLKEELQSKGLDLHLLVGKPYDLITGLVESTEAIVYCSDDIAHDERKLLEKLENTVQIRRKGTFTLYQEDSLPFELKQLPDVFTAFRKKVEKYAEQPKSISEPGICPKLFSLAESDDWERFRQMIPQLNYSDKTAFPFRGGSKAGKARVREYFWESDAVAEYKKTRNGLVGKDYSSKFSAWLSNGSVSPVFIYNELKRYESERTSNQSTYWLYFELLWRDFFQFTALRYGNRLFLEQGLKEGPSRKWNKDERVFESWKNGETAEDFVNANMIELKETGWMSNRGRQNVASYLVHDLNVDWRKGAAWFEHMLIDYDPASNWGNWAYVAGVGNDPRPNRKFNIKRQQDMYDADRKFTELWTHEHA